MVTPSKVRREENMAPTINFLNTSILVTVLALSGFAYTQTDKANVAGEKIETRDPSANVLVETMDRTIKPSIGQIELSPDGSKMLMLRAIENNYYAFAINLKNKKNNPVMASDPGNFSLNWCKWANNKKIICSGSGTIETKARGSRRGPRGAAGAMEGRLMYVVNQDGSKATKLIKKYIPQQSEKEPKYDSPIQDSVISWLPDSPNEILIQYNRESYRWPSVYRLNINNNKMKRVRKYKQQVSQWLADDQGNVKMGIGYKDQGMRLYLVEDNSTRELKDEEIAGLLPAFPLGFSDDSQTIYLAQRNEIGAQKITGVALGDFTNRSTLYSSQVAPFSSDLYSPAALRGPGIPRYEPETPIQHLIGAAAKQHFEAVAKAIPGDKETVVSRTSDWGKFVVYSWDNSSYAYYLFDTSNNQLVKLGGS